MSVLVCVKAQERILACVHRKGEILKIHFYSKLQTSSLLRSRTVSPSQKLIFLELTIREWVPKINQWHKKKWHNAAGEIIVL